MVDKGLKIDYNRLLLLYLFLQRKLLTVKLDKGQLEDLGKKIEEYSLNLNHEQSRQK